MKNKHINLLGWMLFIVSAIGFIIASIGSFWSMFGSVFFLLACLVFLIPFFNQNRKFSGKKSFLEPFVFHRVQSEDGDHFLEKKDSLFFLGYDNHKDLRMWKFILSKSISEQKLTEMFFEKTGRGAGLFDFYKWLNEQGVVLQEHSWY